MFYKKKAAYLLRPKIMKSSGLQGKPGKGLKTSLFQGSFDANFIALFMRKVT